MLRKAFEDAAPYISHLKEIREFVEEFDGRGRDEIVGEIERRIGKSEQPLATDYRILLSKYEEIINKGK